MMKSMKRTNIFIKFATLAASVTMVACTEEEHVTEALTITGTIESPITKTALYGPDAGGVYKTVWKANDEIAIFSGESVSSQFTKHKLLSGDGTNTGQFSAIGVTSNDMLAIYPASIAVSRNGTLATINLPEVQNYVEENIPENAYPMYGNYKNGTLKFVNVCSILKIPMYGDVTVKSITFTPNSDLIKVSGRAVIDWSERVMTMYSPSYTSVKLDCGVGVKLTDTETDFHMVVPPFRYVDGFTLTIATDQGDVVKTLKSTIILDRSVLYPIEAFECKVDEGKDNIVFEDANFKAYLIENFDKDNDGEISFDEALDITKISINTVNVKSLSGIEHMPNLTFLDCNGPFSWDSERGKYVGEGGQLESLDVSHNPKLGSLYCGFNKLTNLDVSNLTSLTRLFCDYNKLTSINLDNTVSLRQLKAYNNNLTYINLRNSKNLTYVDVENNQLQSLDIRQNLNLTYLDCDNNKIPSLDISNNVNLTTLSCYLNNLSELDLSHNAKIEILDCGRNNISSLDLSNCPDLKKFWCRNGILTAIDLNCCPKLESVNIYNNQIKSLDISEITGLQEFNCLKNPLKKLYLFKGQFDAITTKDVPSGVVLIVKGTAKGGNEDTTTGDKFTLE